MTGTNTLKYYSNKAIWMYFVLLLLTPMIFGYPMEWFGYVWGVSFVVLFFYFSKESFEKYYNLGSKTFEKKIFWISFIIRVLYVFFSYWFYYEMTGTQFEFSSADSQGYHYNPAAAVEFLSNGGSLFELGNFFEEGFSDSGYIIFNSIIYYIFVPSVIIARLFNAFFSSFMCVYIYKIANRHFGSEIAKLSAVFCAFCPYFIFYCGLQLKEILMTFIVVVYINSADEIIVENKKWHKWIPMVACGLILFSFRTVLGTVAFLSFFITLLVSDGKKLNWSKRILIIIAAMIVTYFSVSDTIITEVNEVWQQKDRSQEISMEWRSKRKGGNEFAKYASATVFAPLIFTIPFPSMVYTEGQENMRLTNGANYVKNITSFFTIFAVVFLIFSGDWRKNVLMLSFTCGYLVVIAFSSFAQSGRFHVPVMPFELMFAAYGISVIEKKQLKFYNMWLVLMFVACIGWQWFKLAGRGMI